MRYGNLNLLLAFTISHFAFVLDCGAQGSDPKLVEAAKKEGGEIEAYVTLRTDTALTVWKMFETNSAKLLIDFMLSEQVAELLAKEQRLPGRGNTTGLDPVFKEINAEKILALSMEEVQANYRKYLEEFRSYFGK